MINSIERMDVAPICPHCETTLTSIFCRRLSSVFGKRYIFFCPNCRKVLGISHRKGFWMG